MKFEGANILSTKQFDLQSMEKLFERAKKMEKVLNGGKFSKLMDGKVLATLFFEPSTRTRMSFESAFLRLGGKVVSGADMAGTSSARKGETLYDTGRVVADLVDLIVMRHPEAGSVAELARGSKVPVINAGDGANQHPTQALLDVYTMWKEFGGKLSGKTIGMVGDLKYGRVPHSQCDLLKHWKVKFVFVSPAALAMPADVKKDLKACGRGFKEVSDLASAVSKMDVICATRIQAERFKSLKEAAKFKGVYVLNAAMMKKAKKTALLMHPLPRVDEISVEVDKDPRAKYFDQVRNGLALRMALMAEVMGV